MMYFQSQVAEPAFYILRCRSCFHPAPVIYIYKLSTYGNLTYSPSSGSNTMPLNHLMLIFIPWIILCSAMLAQILLVFEVYV